MHNMIYILFQKKTENDIKKSSKDTGKEPLDHCLLLIAFSFLHIKPYIFLVPVAFYFFLYFLLRYYE